MWITRKKGYFISFLLHRPGKAKEPANAGSFYNILMGMKLLKEASIPLI